MQAEMPGVVDLSKESKQTLEMYGIGGPDKDADALGRRCLLARRLVEDGVRFVQVIAMGWDSHDYIDKAHGARLRAIDKPIAGLLKDLKRTGLLDETLVVWAGEFGRSPDNGIRRGSTAWGRDHNANAMPVWLAGGGVNAGRLSALRTRSADRRSRWSIRCATCMSRCSICLDWTITSCDSSTRAARSNSVRSAAR